MPTEKLESLAIQRRLDLEVAEKEVHHLRRALSLARWRRLPEATVGASLEQGGIKTQSGGAASDDMPPPVSSGAPLKPNFDIPPPPPPDDAEEVQPGEQRHSFKEWSPSVEIEVPIFDRGQGEISREEAQWRQAQHRLYALAVHVRSEVRQARDRLLSARAVAEFYRDHLVPEHEKMVALGQSAYDRMHLGNFELIEVKRRELSVRKEANLALADYWIARADLERAIGGLTEREGEEEREIEESEEGETS
jgi:outer membrane protein TolC